MTEERRAALGIIFGLPLGFQFFGSIGLLALGGGWTTFVVFGSLCIGIIVVGALLVVIGAFILDHRDAMSDKGGADR